jgi:hypothetical protein
VTLTMDQNIVNERAQTHEPTWRAIVHSLVKFLAGRVGQRNIDKSVGKCDLCIVQDQQILTSIDILLVPSATWTKRETHSYNQKNEHTQKD